MDKSDLYKLIIETTNEGVWVIDDKNETTFTNSKMNEILGYGEGEMLGKSLFDFMDEEGRELSLKNLEKGHRGASELHEFKFKHKLGHDLWTLINTSPMFHGGQYIGALAMVTDITKKKVIDKNQLEEHRKYISLFEDCPVPIWDEDFSEIKNRIDELREKGVSDFKEHFANNLEDLLYCADGLIVNDVNKAVLELNEAKDKEHMINHYHELATRETVRYVYDQVLAVAEGKTSCSHKATLKTFSGNYRHVLLKWTVVKGYEHNYKRVYLSTTDFTDRIIQENIDLQNTNREKEILLKEIHHRVKNNLQIIMSLLNLQSHSIEDAVTKDLINMSIGRVHSMAIVHELLYKSKDFSKINYGEYLEKLITPLVDSVKAEGVNIDISVIANDVFLNINTSIPLGLLITELITNSLKHGFTDQDGEVYIEIVKSDQMYQLKIGDNGSGFSADFDFKTSDSLGLQLVHNLIIQLSGTIERDFSKKGTHFLISFRELEDDSMRN